MRSATPTEGCNDFLLSSHYTDASRPGSHVGTISGGGNPNQVSGSRMRFLRRIAPWYQALSAPLPDHRSGASFFCVFAFDVRFVLVDGPSIFHPQQSIYQLSLNGLPILCRAEHCGHDSAPALDFAGCGGCTGLGVPLRGERVDETPYVATRWGHGGRELLCLRCVPRTSCGFPVRVALAGSLGTDLRSRLLRRNHCSHHPSCIARRFFCDRSSFSLVDTAFSSPAPQLRRFGYPDHSAAFIASDVPAPPPYASPS